MHERQVTILEMREASSTAMACQLDSNTERSEGLNHCVGTLLVHLQKESYHLCVHPCPCLRLWQRQRIKTGILQPV